MKTQTKIILSLILLFVAACSHAQAPAETSREVDVPAAEAAPAAQPTVTEPAAEDTTNVLPSTEYDCTTDYPKYKEKLADAEDDLVRAEKKLAEASAEDKAKRQEYVEKKQKEVERYKPLVEKGKTKCGA